MGEYIVGFLFGLVSAVLLDLVRHLIYYKNWDYYQKKRFFKKHFKKVCNCDLSDTEVRVLAFDSIYDNKKPIQCPKCAKKTNVESINYNFYESYLQNHYPHTHQGPTGPTGPRN